MGVIFLCKFKEKKKWQNVLFEPSKQYRTFLKEGLLQIKKIFKSISKKKKELLYFKRLFQDSFVLKKFGKIETGLQNVLIYLILHILGKAAASSCS